MQFHSVDDSIMEDLRRQAVLALVTLREGGWIRGLIRG